MLLINCRKTNNEKNGYRVYIVSVSQIAFIFHLLIKKHVISEENLVIISSSSYIPDDSLCECAIQMVCTENEPRVVGQNSISCITWLGI